MRVLRMAGLVCLLAVGAVGCQVLRNSGADPLTRPTPDALRVASYNVHYIDLRQATGAWSRGDWERRKGPMDAAFKAIRADVIGFQEMESFAGGSESDTNLTLDWLLLNNPGYTAAAVGDAAVFPSTQPILYRSDRLALLDQGWFFFSDTPDVIYSRTFNGSYPAFASWARFRDGASGAMFRVLNIHTDYGSRSNRLQSVALAARRLKPWVAAGEAVIVVGDLNARRGSQTLGLLEAEGVVFPDVDHTTYHFNRGFNIFGAIDHIGYAGPITPKGAPTVLADKFQGEWPSDHYPVVLDLALTPP